MDLFDMLREAGVDVETTLHRFMGNRALLDRFVKKFAQDPTYQRLCDAQQANDKIEMEMAAHTLKGTTANLGFSELSRRAAVLVDALRIGEEADQALEAYCGGIGEEYHHIQELISQID